MSGYRGTGFHTLNVPMMDGSDRLYIPLQAFLDLETERDAYREALEKIAVNTPCSIGDVIKSKHDGFCGYHTARTALERSE